MEALQIEEPRHLEAAETGQAPRTGARHTVVLTAALSAAAVISLTCRALRAAPPQRETAGSLSLVTTECMDMAGLRTNHAGFGCQVYTDMPEVCADPGDTADFQASSLCCACGGGFRPAPPTHTTTTTTTVTPTTTTTTTTSQSSCRNSNAMAVNDRGYDCLMYDRMPQLCTHAMHDTADFHAQEMCCVCGGGDFASSRERGIGACWGDEDAGGECGEVDFSNVSHVFVAEEGFVVRGGNGTPQCWGASFLNRCEVVDFTRMTLVHGNRHSVVALDSLAGTGHCWGNSMKGGNCADIDFSGVREIHSTWEAFLAWDVDAGRGTCWGEHAKGGDCSSISFAGVTDIRSTWQAFVAFNRNEGGSGQCWGERAYGGDCSSIDFSSVTEVYSNRYAFVAVDRHSGTGQCWGDISYGGLCDWADFSGQVEVYSNEYAFVIFNRAEGRATCLGDNRRGGSCHRRGVNFTGVTAIYSTNSAFLAFRQDPAHDALGTPNVQCWGRRQDGGNCTGVHLASDTHIYSTGYAFLAFNHRLGQAHCWGDSEFGGSCEDLEFDGINAVYTTRNAFLALQQSEYEPAASGVVQRTDPTDPGFHLSV